MTSIWIGTRQDAGQISRLLIALADEFILGEFSAEGRAHLLKSLSVHEMERRLDGPYRFYVAEAGTSLAGVAAIRESSHLLRAIRIPAYRPARPCSVVQPLVYLLQCMTGRACVC